MKAIRPKPTAARHQSPAKRQMGRPTLYRDEYAEQVFKLAVLGATDVEMAGFFGISEPTLHAWCKAHPDFLKSRARGKLEADASVASRLYQRARGYSHAAVKIFQFQGRPVEVPYTKHYPPDVRAATWWLKNRRPKQWRDKPEADHVLSYEERLKKMTPEELDEDARRLWAEIQEALVVARAAEAAKLADQATDAEYEEVEDEGDSAGN